MLIKINYILLHFLILEARYRNTTTRHYLLLASYCLLLSDTNVLMPVATLDIVQMQSHSSYYNRHYYIYYTKYNLDVSIAMVIRNVLKSSLLLFDRQFIFLSHTFTLSSLSLFAWFHCDKLTQWVLSQASESGLFVWHNWLNTTPVALMLWVHFFHKGTKL